ncbi:MAG: hypothetical protein GY861_18365 [bacterium]|nr:hypothetical protein [bacterium]
MSPQTEKNLIGIMRDFELRHNDSMEKVRLGQQSNKQEIEHVKKTTGRIENKLDKFIDAADKKFANKKVEIVVYGGAATALLALLGAVIRLVVIQ